LYEGEYSHSLIGILAGDAGVIDLTVISPRGAAEDGLVGENGVVGFEMMLSPSGGRSHADIRTVKPSAAVVTEIRDPVMLQPSQCFGESCLARQAQESQHHATP
jgi:hypothetical protein